MARRRQGREDAGLFDVPDRVHDGDDSDEDGDSVGVFGGPTHDSRVLGDPANSTGLFDVSERAPGEMPGLFDRPARTAANGRGLSAKPAAASRISVGVFSKLRRNGRR